MHGTIQKGLRYGAALVLAMALCATAALAAGTEGKRLVPVGHTVGVKLFARGVVVVKLPEGGTPARSCGLQTGDVIEACGGRTVTSTEQFQSLLQENGTETTELSVKRQGSPVTLSVEPERNEEGVCCIGAWVRDSMAGIGTVTYYDPDSRRFGALGHGVSSAGDLRLTPAASGFVVSSRVVEVRRGSRGTPGMLKGDFDLSCALGSVTANNECGVFGVMQSLPRKAAVPVAQAGEAHTGAAAILSNVSGTEIREYTVEILKLYPDAGNGRNLLLKVTDPALLEKTGGIVQGMSGSPILQDGKLIGAVTHVLVNSPDTGYGIFIENMLDAAA